MKLLIVGGYGTFGGRIVELLEGDGRLTLIVAGRSAQTARMFCAARGATVAKLIPALFDRDGDLAKQLKTLAPDIVVDASGPFQDYGARAYALVEACIAAHVHYMDLADGSAFVAGVARYDAEARAAGVYVLSGVSSFPVLTASVVRMLAAPLTRVDEIAGGIAPSPFAGVGENVIRAIASYAGQPVAYLGRTAKIIGRPFRQQRRYTIAPPGRLPLRNTLFSLVDVPDLRVLSTEWPQARRVWMGAGPVPEILHRVLIFFAWLVSFGIVRSLSPLAPLMHWATNHVRWGEHRGGMFVEVKGADDAGSPGSDAGLVDPQHAVAVLDVAGDIDQQAHDEAQVQAVDRVCRLDQHVRRKALGILPVVGQPVGGRPDVERDHARLAVLAAHGDDGEVSAHQRAPAKMSSGSGWDALRNWSELRTQVRHLACQSRAVPSLPGLAAQWSRNFSNSSWAAPLVSPFPAAKA